MTTALTVPPSLRNIDTCSSCKHVTIQVDSLSLEYHYCEKYALEVTEYLVCDSYTPWR